MTAISRDDSVASEPGDNPTLSPAICRHQLGMELRRLREAHGMRLEDVATTLDVAPSTLSRIETGKAPTRTSYLTVMFDVYDITDEVQRLRLADLARAGQCPSWLAGYRDLLVPGAERYLGLEASATAVGCFAAQLIPGLLQTSEYGSAALRIGRPGLAASDVRALVHLQQRRREQLAARRTGAHFILDEAVLVRPVGSPEVMAKQLDHLHTLSTWPQVTIQVLPLSRPWPILSQSFSVLTLAEPGSDALAYGGISGQVVVSLRGAEVSTMRETFAALADAALSPTDSADLIAERAATARLAASD